MTKEIPPGIDTDTIRSKGQFDATVAAAQAGCAWCMSEDQQQSPLVCNNRFKYWRVRRNVFAKPGRDMYILILRRHASRKEVTPEESAEYFAARNWVEEEFGLLGGGNIDRWGEKALHSSSLPDTHFFQNVIAPHGDVPVAETLVKDRSPEKQAVREERAREYVKE